MKKNYIALLLVVFFFACGEDTTYITETNVNQVVAKLDAGQKFSKCTSENFGDMVYAVDSASIFFCDGKSWKQMTMSFEKDTVVKVDSVYVLESDTLVSEELTALLENASDCSLEKLEKNIYMLICSDDTVFLDRKNSLQNYLKSSAIVDSFADSRDDKIYKTIVLGNQTWMAENLNFMDTSLIPDLKEESWCFNNEPENCTLYGRLYTWNVAQEICPSGWHLPKDSEWNELIAYIENVYGLKEWADVVPYLMSADLWKNFSYTDDVGFSSLPAGTKKYNDNSFYGLYEETNYWTSDEVNDNGSCLMIKSKSLGVQQHSKNYGFSVRCLKDKT